MRKQSHEKAPRRRPKVRKMQVAKARLACPIDCSTLATQENQASGPLSEDERSLQSEATPRGCTNTVSPARPEHSPNPELQVFPNIISHANRQFWPHAIVKASGAYFEKDPRNAEPQFAANRIAARSRL